MKASSHEKHAKKPLENQKTKQTKSADPCPLPGLSPDLAHGSELFVFFFCFFWFSRGFGKTAKNTEKKQKVETHVPCQASPQTLPLGLNFFFVFFWVVFSRFWPNCKKPWKNNKNKKAKKVRPMSPARPLPRPCPWV